VDLRIGVTDNPKEIRVEMADDTDVAALRSEVDAAVAGSGSVLWLTDIRGRQVGVPAGKIA
jgi:hypothetical protein